MYPFPEHINRESTVMVFVDGENLAKRWFSQLGSQNAPSHVVSEKDIFVWSELLNMRHHANCSIVRKYYYTSAPGDIPNHQRIFDRLKSLGIGSPHVFPRIKNKRSKRVDITLSVDMLTHAFNKNYDIAVLVAGDEDYVPLVNAVKSAGRQVFVWFVNDGLSPELKRSADYFFDLGPVLCNADAAKHLT